MRSRVVILLLAGFTVAVLLASCATSADPFDFDSDDLCEWVSAEEVAEYVEEAFGWEVTAVVVEPEDEYWDCEWRADLLESAEGVVVYAGEAEWFDFDGNRVLWSGLELVDYSELDYTYVPIGKAVVGHPSVSERVVVHNGGFGAFAFGVPPNDQYLQVQVNVSQGEDWVDFEPKYFSFVDGIINELNWLPTSST